MFARKLVLASCLAIATSMLPGCASYKNESGLPKWLDYDVAGKFVGDLKVGYMSTYKDLNLGMSYSLSAGDAGRQNHTLELTMRVDF